MRRVPTPPYFFWQIQVVPALEVVLIIQHPYPPATPPCSMLPTPIDPKGLLYFSGSSSTHAQIQLDASYLPFSSYSMEDSVQQVRLSGVLLPKLKEVTEHVGEAAADPARFRLDGYIFRVLRGLTRA